MSDSLFSTMRDSEDMEAGILLKKDEKNDMQLSSKSLQFEEQVPELVNIKTTKELIRTDTKGTAPSNDTSCDYHDD